MEDNLIYTLKNMGIYDLRNFARSVGVAKPTTLRREELINAILDIKSGNQEPTTGISRGRKPKNKETANELITKYTGECKGYLKSLTNINCELEVNSPTQQFVYNCLNIKETTYLKIGYAIIKDCDEDGYYFTDEKEKINIPNFFIKKYNIKDGEKVCATCVKREEDFLIVDVVNKQSMLGKKFEELKVLAKTKKIALNSNIFEKFNNHFSVNCGQCVEVCYSNKCAPENILLTLSESLNKSKKEVFALLTDEFNNPDVENNIKRLNNFSVLEDLSVRLEKLKETIYVVREYVENAQNCILIIGNLSLIDSALKEYYIFKGNTEIIAQTMAQKEIMNILALARQTESGSLTIFALSSQNNNSELAPLFNSKIEFESNNGKITISDNSYSIY